MVTNGGLLYHPTLKKLLNGGQRCCEPGPRKVITASLENLYWCCRHGGWQFLGRSWVNWISRWVNKAADKLANLTVDLGHSSMWCATIPVQPHEQFLAYCDGAAKGQPSRGASSYLMLARDCRSGWWRVLAAGAQYWKECTAMQSELGAAALCTKLLRDIVGTGVGSCLHEDPKVPQDLNGSIVLAQLLKFLEQSIEVNGYFA